MNNETTTVKSQIHGQTTSIETYKLTYPPHVWLAVIKREDPFQTGGPHQHNMPLEFVAGDIDFAIRAGEIDEAEERVCEGHPSLHGWSEYCDGSCQNVRARWGHD